MANAQPPRVSLLRRVGFPVALALLLLLCLPVLLLVILHLLDADGAVNQWLTKNFQLDYGYPLPRILGLLFLLVPLAILLLYFLRLKRKPLEVPSTFLWRKSIEDLHVNSLFQWLRENVLLLLQLLVVLLLLYAVMGFRFHGSTAKGQHYILMIDNSASMSATDVKPSRLEWAKREAIKVIDAATEDSVGMVIVFNSRASTLQPYTGNKARLRDAVNSIRPSARPTRIDDALLLADALANQIRSTEDVASRPENVEPGKARTYYKPEGIPTDVYLFSDGRFPEPEVKNLNSLLAGNTSALGKLTVHFQLAGRKGTDKVNNAALVGLYATPWVEKGPRLQVRDSGALKVEVRVRNYSGGEPKVLRVRLEATAGGKTVYKGEQLLELPEKDERGQQVRERGVTFDVPPLDLRGSTVLHAWLDGPADDLPLDDHAWLILGTVRKARVLLVTPGNAVLDAFFDAPATRKLADVERLAPADLGKESYRERAASGRHDLVVFDRCAPQGEKNLPRANTFFIGTPPPPWVRGTRELKNPFLIVTAKGKDHPLLRHLTTLWEVEATEAFRFDLTANLPAEAGAEFNLDGKHPGRKALPSLTRLVEAGLDPVLFTLRRGDYTDLVLTFPLMTAKGDLPTNWPLEPSFPLFMRNVLLVLGNVREGMSAGSVQPGEPMVLRPEAGVEWIEVTPPGGPAKRLTRGKRPDFVYGETDRVGLYRVRRSDGAEHFFAVNLLDARESDIEPRARFRVGEDTVAAGEERAQPRDLWKWLVVAGLGFLLVEWYVYTRRVRV